MYMYSSCSTAAPRRLTPSRIHAPGWHAWLWLPMCAPDDGRSRGLPRALHLWPPLIHARRHTVRWGAMRLSPVATQCSGGGARGAVRCICARRSPDAMPRGTGTGTGTPYVNVMYRTKKRAVPRARLACGQRHSTKAGGGDPSQLPTDAFPFSFTIACDEKYPWNLESSLSIHTRNKLLSIWIFSGSKYPTWQPRIFHSFDARGENTYCVYLIIISTTTPLSIENIAFTAEIYKFI